MADIESNIKVNIDTSDALAQLKLLQQQISAFQQAMRNAGAANAKAAAAMQQNLITSINATGKFSANIQTIKSSAESFTESLEKNKMSIGEYFRYAGGASKTFGKLFKSEFQTIQQVAVDRVKTLQTQYIKLGRDANGALKAIAVRPLALDMQNVATKTQIAAQRQQLFNQLMKQGSTQLLNFGKNTQWAGRQLMVGFTIPLTMAGSAAAKAYMEIEKASIKFKRVYGDMNTTTEETNKMVKSIQAMANEFTKYGLAVSETMDMAASAAAMGKTGADLMAQVAQASKLAVLGGVEQQQALDTTISLTNAFKVSTDQLAGSVDFLNAVENQTVLSIEDMTIAIPKAAPVIQQLGGDVKDLAFFLTAMREGGINASEGANALKSGLASMINPTAKASEFLQKFGINVKGIVEANKGDIRGTVIGFAKALDTLDPLNRARAIEQMFGKFQFSRLSTLFQNVISEGSQANNVLSIANATAEELAVLSEREMKKVEDSPMFKFQKSIEQMQAKLAPIGEAFLKAVTPIIDFVSKILDGFNNLSEGSKQFITILVTAVAGIGPILLMTFGLIANGVANIMKLFTNIKGFINKTTKPSDILGEQTKYMTTEQLKGAAIAASLDQAHAKLRQTFTSEAAAVDALTQAYRRAVEAQQAYSGIPGVPVGNPNAVPPKKYAGGVSMVPGPKGAGDIIPALLSPGEAVIPAKSAQKYAPVIRGMIAGNLPGFEDGTPGAGMRQSVIGPLTEKQTEGLARTGKTLKEISDEVYAGPYNNMPITDFGTQITPTTGHSFPAFGVGGIYQKPDGTKVFVKPQIDATSALAEIRGTTIARDAHGLVAPQQKLAVMMDPTDPEGRRKFLVLESALDPRLADVPKTFSKDNYIKQLVASLLRGDKDLGVGNLGENILADVGPAGVFQRASGKRQLGGKINSMEEQAIINLLGVKGGAKKFFAESTAEIAKSMTAAEFDALIKNEIQTVMPKLAATIAGFGNLSPEEKAAYQAMQERLQAGMSVDWTKYHAMHSVVKPRNYLEGTAEVKTFLPDEKQQKKFAENLSKAPASLYEQYVGLQDTHIVPGLNITDQAIIAQLEQASDTQISQERLRQSGLFALANVTATFPTKLNQRMKTGNPPSGILFSTIWNSYFGKLRKLVKVSGATSITGDLLEQRIGAESSRLTRASDNAVSELVMEILGSDPTYQKILTQASRVGVVRTSLSRRKEEAEAQGRTIGESQALYEAMVRGELSPNTTASSIDADIRENQNDDVTNPGFARIGRLADGSYKFTTSDISSKIIFNAKQRETIAEIFQERLRMEAKAKLRQWFDNNRPTEVPETGLLDSQLPKAYTKIAPREQDYELIKNIFDSKEWKQFEGLSKEQQATTIESLLTQRGQQLLPGFSGKLKTVALRGSATGLGAYNTTDENQNIFRQISYESQTLKPQSEFRTNRTGQAALDSLHTLISANLFAGPKKGILNTNISPFVDNVLKLAKGTPEVKPTGKPKASVFDIDDTLVHAAALIESNRAKNEKLPKEQRTKWYEELAKNPQGVTAAIERLKAAQARGNKILLMTARPEAYRASTLEMLEKLGIDMKGIQLISRRDKDYRKPEQMKFDKTSKYMQWYDIEEFYDDLPETRDAISTLGIKVFDPLKLAKGGIIPGYAEGTPKVFDENYNMSDNPNEGVNWTKIAEENKTGQRYFLKNKGNTKKAILYEVVAADLLRLFGQPTQQIKVGKFGKNLINYSEEDKNFQPDTVKPPFPAQPLFDLLHWTDFHGGNIGMSGNQIKVIDAGGALGLHSDGTEYWSGNPFTPYEDFEYSASSTFNELGKYTEKVKSDRASKFSKEAIRLLRYMENVPADRIFGTILKTLGQEGARELTPTILSRRSTILDYYRSIGVLPRQAHTKASPFADADSVHKYANGVFSVPGPKGAGDVVPAMLSPGEAVIPAKQAEQHRGLITQMIAGNLPGYAKGTPGIGSKIISGAKTVIAKLILPAGFADGMNVEVDAGSTTKAKSKVVDDQTKVQDKAEKLLKREQEEAKQKTKLNEMSDEILDQYVNSVEGMKNIEFERHRVLLKELDNLEKNQQNLNEQERQIAIAEKQREVQRSREELRTKEAEKGWFKRTRMTGAITGGLYAISGALSALSAVPGDVGKAAQAALPSIGAMTTAMSIIPGKAGLVVGALAALATVFVQIQDDLNKTRDEARKLHEDLGSGNAAINKFAEFAKKVTANEIMNKRREASAGQYFNIVPGKKTFGESYMETDAGKELVKNFQSAIKSDGMEQAKKLLLNQLTTAVTSGAMSAAQARSIANNLGAQMKDMTFGIDVGGKITDLLGPNGEDLKKEPLEVRMKLIASSMDIFRQQSKAMSEKYNAQTSYTRFGSEVGMGAATGVPSALAGTAVSKGLGKLGETLLKGFAEKLLFKVASSAAFGPILGTVIGIGTAIKDAIDYQKEMAIQGAKMQVAAADTLAIQQQMVDSLQLDYEKRIAAAEAAGKTAEAQKLQLQYSREQQELLLANQKNTEEIYASLNEQAGGLFGTGIFSAIGEFEQVAKDSLKKAFEGTGREIEAELAQKSIDAMTASQSQKAMLATLAAQKLIGFNQLAIAEETFGGSQEGADQLQKLLEQSPTEANRALSLSSNIQNMEERKQFLIDISLQNPTDAKATIDALELVQKTTGVFVTNPEAKQAIIEFGIKNPEKALELKNIFEQLSKQKTINIDVIQRIMGDDIAAYFNDPSFQKYYKTYGKNEVKTVFLTEFQQIMSMNTDGDGGVLKNAYLSWLSENGNDPKLTFADFALYQADRTATGSTFEAFGLSDSSGTDGGPQSSILDQFVQMTRESSNFRQNLTIGWTASYAALKKYTTDSLNLMAGWAVRLKQLGVDSNMINVFMGATEEEQNRILDKRTGQMKAGALKLLKQLKVIQDNKDYGLSWILASPQERLERLNTRLSAGLDVIAGKEKVINEKYDKRLKALDEIGKAQEKNNAVQQDQLDVAEALSRGDISSAAKAAMKMRQDAAAQALQDAREKIELARKQELATLTAQIGDELLTREQIEYKIANHSQKIASYKLLELNRQQGIADAAERAAEASATQLENGTLLSQLPGSSNGNGTVFSPTDLTTTPTEAPGTNQYYMANPSTGQWEVQTLKSSIINPKTGKQYAGIKLTDAKNVQKLNLPSNASLFQIDYGTETSATGMQEWGTHINLLASGLGIDKNKIAKGTKFSWKNVAYVVEGVLGDYATFRKQFTFFNRGGMVIPKGYAYGGGIYGTDTVPAMLTPGEFVIKKSSVDAIGSANLNKLNNEATIGDSVYNYTIQVNVKSDSSPKDIADTVLKQIERLDAQRLRGVSI